MRLFDNNHRILSLFLALSAMVGCVKENRDECPCRLIVDLLYVDGEMMPSVDLSVVGTDGFAYNGQRAADTYADDEPLLVPKGEVFLNVCYGDRGLFSSDGLLIPQGEDCPFVYMYSAMVDTDSEYVRETVRLRKNHCVMTICLEDEGNNDFKVILRGNVCGYNASGTPREGSFLVCPELSQENTFQVVVPRQMDASLLLDVSDGQEVQRTFAIGEYIRKCGYDWTQADLRDVTVEIDYSQTQMTVSIQGWDEVYEFDIVI